MVPAGAAAQSQGESVWYLALLAMVASTARIIAGTILFFVADKLEDVLLSKGRSFFGMTHKNVEGLGKKLSSKHPGRTWLTLFALSAIPFLPTATLSLTAGFVKIRYSTFITSNFLGSIANSMFFLYLGYVGLESAKIISKLDYIGQAASIVAILLLLIWILWWRFGRKKTSRRNKSN